MIWHDLLFWEPAPSSTLKAEFNEDGEDDEDGGGGSENAEGWDDLLMDSEDDDTGGKKEYQPKKHLENILILILFQCVYLITKYGEKYFTVFYHNENLIIVHTFRITCHKIW